FYSVRAGAGTPAPYPRAPAKKKKKTPPRGFFFYKTRNQPTPNKKNPPGKIKNKNTTTPAVY
ncbi:hypothetical protein ACVGX7_00235, partial [Enterobacter hormaechei]